MPRARTSANWSIGMPYIRSMQITRGPHSSRYTSGAVIHALSPKASMAARNRTWRSASMAKSSSSLVTWWRSSTMPGALRRCPVRVRSTSRAMRYMIRRSRFIRSAMAGRWIFSTASRPSRSTQACTWAIDAADSGTGSTSSNSSATGAPRSSSTMASASRPGTGGTSSRVRRHASASGAGNMPGDDAIICPSFTNVGPSAMNASTSAMETASASRRRAAAVAS